METLAFIHTAVAYEDPTPEAELRSFDDLHLKAPGSIALGVLSAGIITTTLSHADQAQALIYRGDRGSGVAQLQRKLGVTADGVFGPQTYNSVAQHQSNSGLRKVDGIAGPETLVSLGLPASLGPGPNIVGPGPIEKPAAGTAYVTPGIGVKVRSSPFFGNNVVRGLPYGARVRLTGNSQNGWSELTNGDWVASQYLSSFSGSNGSEASVPTGSYITAGIGVKVRSSPFFGNNVVGGLPYGARVRLTGNSQNGWSELTNGNWVASDFIGYR